MIDNTSNSESTDRPTDPAVRMVSITKGFPGVVANQDVSLTVQPATFHAVIGENGAGKSTLLNILYGRYRQDAGQIFLQGRDVTNAMHSPADAIRLGLGLVSQHYALIPALTILENIVLGAEPAGPLGILNRRTARERIRLLTHQLNLEDLDLGMRAGQVSVATGQKIEIVKALFHGAKTLLLDEPTATLAPQEAESLFALLGALLANGTTIVFVTHKLREVMAYSRHVTVLRGGRLAGDFVTADTSPEELLAHMIGTRSNAAPVGLPAATDAPLDGDRRVGAHRQARELPVVATDAPLGSERRETGAPLLRVDNLSVKSSRGSLAVRNACLEVSPGEIVGVAGVDGSGQRELAEAIVGLRHPTAGRIEMPQEPGKSPTLLNPLSVRDRQRIGIAYIPEDRHQTALALDFSVAENYLLGHETEPQWGGGLALNTRRMNSRANDMVAAYDVRMGDRDARAPARALSGGNQQKIVIARALDSAPRLLIACQPTRGLDVEATRFVYRTLRNAKARGLGILLFSLDLDELLELSDRIFVLFNGQVAGTAARSEATPEGIGALMTGSVLPSATAGEGART